MHYIVFLYGLIDDKATRPHPVATDDIALIHVPDYAFGFYFSDKDGQPISLVHIFEDGAGWHGLGQNEVSIERPNQKISA